MLEVETQQVGGVESSLDRELSLEIGPGVCRTAATNGLLMVKVALPSTTVFRVAVKRGRMWLGIIKRHAALTKRGCCIANQVLETARSTRSSTKAIARMARLIKVTRQS